MKLKTIFALSVLFTVLFASSSFVSAQYVNGHYRSNGTYVNGYHRTEANDTKKDNYSYYGNVNPYTGKRGTHR